MAKHSPPPPQILRCGRSCSPNSPKVDISHATGVFSFSHLSSENSLSQQGQGGPVTATLNIYNDSASDFNPDQQQNLLVVPGRSPATASQTSLLSQQSTPPPRQDGNPGTIYIQNTHDSRNVSVQGDGNNVSYSNTVVNSSNKFMAKLLKKTIPGAGFDSSARDPPPRCHPGTRLAILARCFDFIVNASGEKKVRWVVGKAGVGKSAIMQNIADSYFSSKSTGASIFFSINGRNDGAKAIVTLAYQLAASCEPYRALIEDEITHKPSLLESSLSVQFKTFILEPFVHHPQLNSLGRVLIIVDGLDECDTLHTSRELLQLISDACLKYPSSPLVWIIASRPEPHITSFFARDDVGAVYEKEEILVDSDIARRDVERFLRDELTRIQKEFSVNSRPQWPRELDFWKLANASGGLFVFADTAIKYIGDRAFGNPTSQLNDVLKAIDAHPLPDVPQEGHPMARLDALYAQILSKIPKRVMENTRKILLALAWDSKAILHTQKRTFIVFCNSLGMTCEDAYAAIRHLSAVLDAPPRDEAHKKELRSFHKSFLDYISDFTRSRFSPGIGHEAGLLNVRRTLAILEQTPVVDDVDDYNVGDYSKNIVTFGRLAHGRGISGNISLAWPIDEENDWNDTKTRLEMYKWAISNVVEGIKKGKSAVCTEFCIRLVTSRFKYYDYFTFPYHQLQSLVFESPRRSDLINHGLLKQVPVKRLHYASIRKDVRLRFRRPNATQKQVGTWGEGKAEDLETKFTVQTENSSDHACCIRLERQLEDCQSRYPDHPTTILFTSADKSLVEFKFVDLDDGVSEWTYWLVYEISKYDRKKLGSTV